VTQAAADRAVMPKRDRPRSRIIDLVYHPPGTSWAPVRPTRFGPL
jgi:hypothetical protein